MSLLRVPFFGMLSPKAPLDGLVVHYKPIALAMDQLEEALQCYLEGEGLCQSFINIVTKVDKLEDEADKIKRSIRNHLPRGLFMPVDKTLFFQYTRSQDNILDACQEALNWLGMRPVTVDEEQRKGLYLLQSEAIATVGQLEPALNAAIGLIHGVSLDRQATKERMRDVRRQHKKVWQEKCRLTSKIYSSDMDFKDIHQLLHFVQRLFDMSHNAETCADLLRAMIAR